MRPKTKKRVINKNTNPRQKIWWILGTIILILIIVFLLYQVKPQASPDMSDTGLPGFEGDKEKIDQGLDTAGNIKEGLTDEEKRNETTEYLKQEWGKILRKNQYLAPLFDFWDIASPIINPIFNLLLGVEISLSWLFILIIALCVLFFMYTKAILLGFSDFSKLGSALIATGFLMMFAVTRVIKMLAEWIISLISLFTKWYVQLIFIVII